MVLNILSKTNTGGLSGTSLKWGIIGTASAGFSLFGYDQGLMSGIITNEDFQKTFPPTSETVDKFKARAPAIQGGVTASYEVGCFVGAMFSLVFGDYFGRRIFIIVGSLFIVLGTVISVTCFQPKWQLGQFVVGRVICGIGNGLDTANIPIWQSEMSQAENRGLAVNFEGSVIAVGTMIAYWVDYGMSYTTNSAQWRFPVSLQILFAILLFFGIVGLPESPRWLTSHGKKAEALSVLSKLHKAPEVSDEVIAEYIFLEENARRMQKSKITIGEIMRNGKQQYLNRILIGASGQFFQQFTGCNAAIYYATLLFQQSVFGPSEKKLSLLMGAVFASVYALFTLPSFFLVETLGRRPLFMIGALGQGISFTITFACLIPSKSEKLADGSPNPNGNKDARGAAVGLFLFIAFFGFTILPMPWIYAPEINPMKTRSIGTAIATSCNWISNAAVVVFTPVFVNNGGHQGFGCYLFFACMSYLYFPVILFFYPETAGRSLEEIDIIFCKASVEGKPPFRVAATMPKLSSKEIGEQCDQLGIDDDLDKEKVETAEKTSSDNGTGKEEGLLQPNEDKEELSNGAQEEASNRV